MKCKKCPGMTVSIAVARRSEVQACSPSSSPSCPITISAQILPRGRATGLALIIPIIPLSPYPGDNHHFMDALRAGASNLNLASPLLV